MFRRNREEFERRRIERQNKVYNDLMGKSYARRLAGKSRSRTLEYRASSVALWAMLSGLFIAALMVAENLDHFAVPLTIVAAIVSFVCLSRYILESTVLAVDLRAVEQRVKADVAVDPVAAESVSA